MLWTFSKGSDSVQDEESLTVSSKVRLLTKAFHRGSLQKERRGRIQTLSKGNLTQILQILSKGNQTHIPCLMEHHQTLCLTHR